MPGLLNLSTELRLAIFKDIFEQEDERALTHPLLHVCQTTRIEYIDVLSGQFSLNIVGIPGAGYSTGYEAAILLWRMYESHIPKLSIIRNHDGTHMLPRRTSMDLFTFADSPFAWLIEHASSALIKFVDYKLFYKSYWKSPVFLADYSIKLGQDFTVEPLFEGGIWNQYGDGLISVEEEMLDFARIELNKWTTEQIDKETSASVIPSDATLNGRQRRCMLAFMRDFDDERLKGLMASPSRRAASEDQALIYQALVGIFLLVSENMCQAPDL
ncbi:hypothetical protein KCU78_g3789, partial [Aureobasidium melanogenum]